MRSAHDDVVQTTKEDCSALFVWLTKPPVSCPTLYVCKIRGSDKVFVVYKENKSHAVCDLLEQVII